MTLAKSVAKFTLNNGVKIPAVGLGTWRASDDSGLDAVKYALANGYTHIDTATVYGNESEVGEAIKESGIPREQLFITTKLFNNDHKRVAAALEDSLKKLGTDYVDLYLIHWPYAQDPATKQNYTDWTYVDTYKELQKLYASKKVRAIGVSNFGLKEFKTLFADPEVTVVPVVNQIEAHPLLQQRELFEYLKSKDILVEAYSPLGSDGAPLLKNEKILEIAKKNGADAGQVIISWSVQRGTVVLPKSVKESRIASNLKTFVLSKEDFDTVSALETTEGTHRYINPPFYKF